MACLDNKHRMKIGEPGFPVAAAEHGQRMLVSVGSIFEGGDHDFTKFSMVPSVVLVSEIPGDIASSWYAGNVFVSLKDAAFEPSSPMHRMAHLYSLLYSHPDRQNVLLLYTDGGPDHRVTYVSVQLALIAVFRLLDLDFLFAACTAPCHL